jgi:hypothetical protein
MNQIIFWLSGGDLRSDGMANEVVDLVLENCQLLDDLLVGLNQSDNVIRARTADVLEKVARVKPELMDPHISKLIQIAKNDQIVMVKMHLAMLFGHQVALGKSIPDITEILFRLLRDDSVFTTSWAIVSLCIVARKYPYYCGEIIKNIEQLQTAPSIAIRTRSRKAMALLINENTPFPKGWIKSKLLDDL